MLLTIPALLFGQIGSVADSIPQLPKALRTSEIAEYGQQTRQLVSDVRMLMSNREKLRSVGDDIIANDSVRIETLELLRDTLVDLSLDKLDRLENEVTLYKNNTKKLRADILTWRALTDQYDKDIYFNTEVWHLTSDSIVIAIRQIKEKDPTILSGLNKVKGRIENNLERITSLEEEFKRWQRELLEAENALTISGGELDEAFELIQSRKQKFINNIWIPEYPPIWAVATADSGEHLEKSIEDSVKEKLILFKRYNADNSEFYINLLISFLLILGLILYMRKKINSLFKSHPDIQIDNNPVLQYPVLSTFVILTYVTFIVFNIPDQLTYILLFFAIFPFSILLWELKTPAKNHNVFFFILFALIFIYLSVFSEAIKELRFTMLFINALFLYALLVVKKNGRMVTNENSYWLGTLPVLIPVCIFICIVAIISNIIGSVQLSLVLSRTVAGTFLAFIVIKESVKLIQSFIFLMLIGPLFKVSNIIKEDSEIVLRWLEKFLKVASYFYWLYIILGLLKIGETLLNSLLNLIKTPLQVGEISISLENILIFYFILQVSIWCSKFIRYFLDKEVYPRTQLDKGVSSTISLMIRYTLAFFGFILALAGAGVELSKVALGISALGIGIGFGLQNIVNNFVSGIILAL